MEYAAYAASNLQYVAKAGVDTTRFCNLQANESFLSSSNGTCDFLGYGEVRNQKYSIWQNFTVTAHDELQISRTLKPLFICYCL